MSRALTIVWWLLACAGMPAQKSDSLLERIRNVPLPAEQRAELVRALESKEYSRMEALLEARRPEAGKPQLAEIEALAGAVEFMHGRMQRAAEMFAQSEGLAPLDDRDRFTWAMALVNLGDTQPARTQLARLNSAHPDSPIYVYWLGRMDYDQRLYEDAVEKFKRVIRMEPNSVRAYDNLGLALDMLGRTDEARDAFLKATELNRKLAQPSAWPPHNLGTLLLRTQQIKEAEEALREALRYDARFSMAHYHLGRVLDAVGRDDEAITEYQAATTLEPVVVEAFYSLGLVYRRHGRTAEANAVFTEYKKRKTP